TRSSAGGVVPLAPMWLSGRALPWQGRGRAFDPRHGHHSTSKRKCGERRCGERNSDASTSSSPCRGTAVVSLTASEEEPGVRKGEREIRAYEAARERGDDRTRGSRQDDADGGDHDGAREAVRGRGAGLRADRQRAGGEG